MRHGALLVACALASLLPGVAWAAPRDPMRPPQPVAPAAPAVRAERLPVLTAVMGRDERRVAIVDGRVVRAGDAIAGGRIEEVTARGVRYRRGAELRELRLGATAEIKKPAAATAPGRIRIERSTAHEAAVAEER